MARIKGALNARKKHNRVLKLAKGLPRATEEPGPSSIESPSSPLCVRRLLHSQAESRRRDR